MPAVIETPRLLLRELDHGDTEFVAGLFASPEVMRHYPRTMTRDEAVEWIKKVRESYSRHGFGLWAVECGGELIGQCGIMFREVDGANEPEIGYMFQSSAWGRGYATEAARASLDVGFGRFALPRLVSLIRPVNTPSIRVAQRVGMACWKHVPYKGLDHLVFRIDRPAMTDATGGIRVACGADFDGICELSPYTRIHEPRAATVRKAIDEGRCFVTGPGVVAFGVMSVHFYDHGFIDLLVVKESERRKGHGRALMDHMLRACATPKLFTSTNRSNLPMQALLAKLGYARCGEIDQLDEGDPEWVYVKHLRR